MFWFCLATVPPFYTLFVIGMLMQCDTQCSTVQHSGCRLYLRSVAVCVVSRSVNCCVALGRIIKLVCSHLCPGASTLHTLSGSVPRKGPTVILLPQ